MTAVYIENDAFAVGWLRALIAEGVIAPGEIAGDIRDVRPADLRHFTQVHAFAGIGVWSYALRLAGWPDDRPVWTGSCPCQPFSAAGKRGGVADERHLWPSWFWLIDQCRPVVVLGEQVASRDGLAWLDLVFDGLEGAHYAVGALDSCAAGFGAPNIRQRLWVYAERLGNTRLAGLERFAWDVDPGTQSRRLGAHPARPLAASGGAGWLADAGRSGALGWPYAALGGRGSRAWLVAVDEPASYGADRRLADAGRNRLDDQQGEPRVEGAARQRRHQPVDGGGDVRLALADAHGRAIVPPPWLHGHRAPRHDDDGRRGPGGLADPGGARVPDLGRGAHAAAPAGVEAQGIQWQRLRPDAGHADGFSAHRLADAGSGSVPLTQRRPTLGDGHGPAGADGGPGPVNGFWRASDWLFCRDGRWRPVEPETFPLADGVAARVGRLRGYGNALNAQQAKHFIEIVMEERGDEPDQRTAWEAARA